ncbi:hypothetical protein [Nannocystis bainbridge]|uniref:Uncharacterized protein n=1 Tax=Nannocystis bainbridge TaxID=2995303 RepID=A0ABT5E0M6_9BACT|nr:hypothetical protein [Nannocystis bainbridge]MDC0719423.1 hypothetical protein [Nannocystis bainbridge]
MSTLRVLQRLAVRALARQLAQQCIDDSQALLAINRGLVRASHVRGVSRCTFAGFTAANEPWAQQLPLAERASEMETQQ